MTDPDRVPTARPPQVTVAGWTIAIASGLLVVSVFDSLGRLRSVDMRQQLTEALDSASARGLGITVDQATDLMHVALVVTAVAAVAASILGIFVLQRHTGARIGVSVLAVPILLAAPFAGGFWGTLVACAAILLWTRPARDWFAGRPPTPVLVSGPAEPPEPSGPSAPLSPPAAPPSLAQPPSGQPAPMPYWGQPVPPPAPWMPRPPVRPAQLQVACIVAAVITTATALFLMAVLAFLAIDSDALVEAVRESPEWDPSYDDRLVVPAMVLGGLVLLAWCLATLVLVLFAWRRHRWAWALLVASAGLATVVSMLAFPVGLLNVAAAGVTTVLLLTEPVRAWYRNRPRQGPPMPPYPPPQQQPPGRPPVW